MLKRSLDILISALGFVLFGPVMAVVAVLVRCKIGSPVLFRQVRPGRHGRPFGMVKFRTMTNERGPDGQLRPDVDRLTDFGRWLRATSLDELPELWNVFVGDMSLVGPRPLLMEYLPLYSAKQARRHDVRPGITGWAQINGRNGIGWDEKFELDVWYVEHQSFWLDLRIFFLTFARIVRPQGVTGAGAATMTAFEGSPTAADAKQHG